MTSCQPALFDIIADPLEQHDLAGERPLVLRELRLRYAEIMTRLRQRGRAQRARPGQEPNSDEEQLRYLGYVDG